MVIDWDRRLEVGLGMLGLSPNEFWNMTMREFSWKVAGFAYLEDLRMEKLMTNAYYAGYAYAPRKKGNKPMSAEKFVDGFISDKRKTEKAKARIERINKIVKESKRGI